MSSSRTADCISRLLAVAAASGRCGRPRGRDRRGSSTSRPCWSSPAITALLASASGNPQRSTRDRHRPRSAVILLFIVVGIAYIASRATGRRSFRPTTGRFGQFGLERHLPGAGRHLLRLHRLRRRLHRGPRGGQEPTAHRPRQPVRLPGDLYGPVRGSQSGDHRTHGLSQPRRSRPAVLRAVRSARARGLAQSGHCRGRAVRPDLGGARQHLRAGAHFLCDGT